MVASGTGSKVRWSFDARKTAYKANDIHWFFQSFKQKTVGGITPNQIKDVQKQMAKIATGQSDVVKASLGIKKGESYSSSDAKELAKKQIKSFTIKSVFEQAGSKLTDELFDLNSLPQADRALMEDKIKELVLERL